MDHKEVLILFLLVLIVAIFGLVLFYRQSGPTGELISPQLRQTIFEVPNIELPDSTKPLRQPYAGRCIDDRNIYVAYLSELKPQTDYAFDGCYEAWDKQDYYFDFYCEGDKRMSQVWVEITPGCKEMPRYIWYEEAKGNYPY